MCFNYYMNSWAWGVIADILSQVMVSILTPLEKCFAKLGKFKNEKVEFDIITRGYGLDLKSTLAVA